MQQPTMLQLEQLLDSLDASISSAIASPEYAGLESLVRAEALCQSMRVGATCASGQPSDVAEKDDAQGKSQLLWEIRARLGRLKLLLDSGADFYRRLSALPVAEVGYDVRGEWIERSGSHWLRLDC